MKTIILHNGFEIPKIFLLLIQRFKGFTEPFARRKPIACAD